MESDEIAKPFLVSDVARIEPAKQIKPFCGLFAWRVLVGCSGVALDACTVTRLGGASGEGH